MNFKKVATIAAAAGALAAISVPAMALENEFHGSYKFMGYQTNFFDGATFSQANANTVLRKDAHSGFFAEQRARLQYTAKANADLKLVTQFELDTRFGGKTTSTGYLGTTSGNDGGNIDADQLTLETKSIYLDYNCPLTGANVKAGMQPWADSYQSLFLLADMTGLNASKKMGPATVSMGWFRFDDNTTTADLRGPGSRVADLAVLDGKFSINKDMTVGASYYHINNNTTATAAVAASASLVTGAVTPAVAANARAAGFDTLHMVGLNADLNVGPANIKAFGAYQMGDKTATTDLKGYLLGVTSKTKVGPGAINLSAIYMSGDNTAAQEKSFVTVGPNQTYFNASNMWLLVRNGQAVNSSTSILGNDMTCGGAGLTGAFAGYEGTADKIFYNANVGYAQLVKVSAGDKKPVGTEINAQVGYKLYDNLSVSGAVAYALLGKAFADGTGTVVADDPYAVNLQLSYTF